MYRKHAGFSLLEILVVIVIIAIIATLMHKEYQGYVIRAQVDEAIGILDEYQATAEYLQAQSGNIAPYYVLFSQENTSGLVSGTPTGTSAVKSVSLRYASTVTADSGTTGGYPYILLGVGLVDTGVIVSGSDHVYIAGVQNASGAVTWQCGSSVSKGNTVPNQFLPATCQNTLP